MEAWRQQVLYVTGLLLSCQSTVSEVEAASHWLQPREESTRPAPSGACGPADVTAASPCLPRCGYRRAARGLPQLCVPAVSRVSEHSRQGLKKRVKYGNTLPVSAWQD